MITYWTWSPEMPARSSAALMAKPPRFIAVKLLSAPESFPIGVRAPATMTEPGIETPLRCETCGFRAPGSRPPPVRSARIRLRVHTNRPRRCCRPRPRGEHLLVRVDLRVDRRDPGDP